MVYAIYIGSDSLLKILAIQAAGNHSKVHVQFPRLLVQETV